jgi:hypothetical protein
VIAGGSFGRTVAGWVEAMNAEEERDQLLSAIKQHRNATVSRLKLLAGAAKVPETSDLMLKPDRDLYESAERLPGYEKGAPKDALSKIDHPAARKDSQAAA